MDLQKNVQNIVGGTYDQRRSAYQNEQRVRVVKGGEERKDHLSGSHNAGFKIKI